MASFTETASLKLLDQASGPARKINRELAALFATANKLKRSTGQIKIGATGIDRTRTAIAALGKDLTKLQRVRALPPIVVRVDSGQVQRALTRINQLRAAAGQPFPSQRLSAAGGGSGVPRVPLASAGQGAAANVFSSSRSDNNWIAAGKIIARSFVSAIGIDLHSAMRGAGRTAGSAISGLDTARALASASGVDPDVLERAALAAANRTTGVSAGEIASASIEQSASLTAQLKSGAISAEEFSKRVTATAQRVADTAQILGTARGDFRGGGEDARQIEKAIAISGAGLDPARQKTFSDAMLNAVIASGGDVRGDEIKRMLQQFGAAFSAGLSAEGVARLALIRDEGGKQSTAEIRQTQQDLIRGNLNRDDKARQVAMGLRDAQGRTTLTESDFADPVKLVEEKLKPLARARGVDMSNVVALQEFYDNVAGLTTSGAKFAARATQASEQYANELQRFRATDARKLQRDPTIAASLAEVQATFGDMVAQQSKSIVPLMKAGAAGLSGTFEALGKGELPSATQVAGTLAAAGSLGLAAMMDPATRPLGAAGLALTGSASALSGAAVALAGAAGVSATADTLGHVAKGSAGGAAATAAGGAAGGALRFLGPLGTALAGIIGAMKATEKSGEPQFEGDPNAAHDRGTKMRRAANEAVAERFRQERALLPSVTGMADGRAAERSVPVQTIAKSALAGFASGRAAERSVPMPDPAKTALAALAAGRAAERAGPPQDAAKQAASKTATDRLMEDLAESQNIKVEMRRIEAQIADQKAKEKLPGTADAATHGLQNQLAQLTSRLGEVQERLRPFEKPSETAAGSAAAVAAKAALPSTEGSPAADGTFSPTALGESLSAANAQFATTFATGAENLKAVAPAIEQAGPVLASAITGLLTGAAGGIGSAIASAFVAGASGLTVGISGAKPSNTGTTQPGGI